MKKKCKVNLLCRGLPKRHKYRDLSKDSILNLLLTDRYLQKHTHVDNDYSFNKEIVAIFNFEDQPIFEKYASLIVDAKLGLILCEKSPKRMLHHLFIKDLLLNVQLQKLINGLLNFKFNHSVSLGQHAFLAIHGYSQKSTAWVGMHQMVDFDCNASSVTFKTRKIHGVQYKIKIHHGQKYFARRIRECITHNWAFKMIYENTFKAHGWHLHKCDRQIRKQSILHNSDYLIKRDLKFSTKHYLKEIVEKINDDYFNCIIEAVAKAFDLKLTPQDVRQIKAMADRKKSIM